MGVVYKGPLIGPEQYAAIPPTDSPKSLTLENAPH